jgi:hypothetical protein
MAESRLFAVAHPGKYKTPEYSETPIDELTGLPWCFAPNPDLCLPSESTGDPQDGEWNHQFPKVEVRYSKNPILTDLGREALEGLRWQWVGYDDHHLGYNPEFRGPRQPATTKQLATTMLFGRAGYIPPDAIDFTGDRAKVRHLTDEERRYLWESRQVRVATPGLVDKFLFRYAFSHEVDHIEERYRDEYLHTYNHERRIYLAHYLSAQLIERAVEPMQADYQVARRQGGFFFETPPQLRDLVKAYIVSGRRFGFAAAALTARIGQYNRELKVA